MIFKNENNFFIDKLKKNVLATTTTTCMPICLNWQCWINTTGTISYSSTTVNSSTDSQTTILSSTTTTSSTDVLLQSNINDLQNENYRLKLGLGIGLGVPLLATSSLALGSFIYYSRR